MLVIFERRKITGVTRIKLFIEFSFTWCRVVGIKNELDGYKNMI